MKLHLPSSLRKALLACLAAVVFPGSYALTIGSGAFLSFLAAQQALAADVTVSNGQLANLIDSETDNAEGVTWINPGTNSHGFRQKESVIKADIQMNGNMDVGQSVAVNESEYETPCTVTFNGAISGDGRFNFWGGQRRIDNISFQGSMLQFGGILNIAPGGAEKQYHVTLGNIYMGAGRGQILMSEEVDGHSSLTLDNTNLRLSRLTATNLILKGYKDATISITNADINKSFLLWDGGTEGNASYFTSGTINVNANCKTEMRINAGITTSGATLNFYSNSFALSSGNTLTATGTGVINFRHQNINLLSPDGSEDTGFDLRATSGGKITFEGQATLGTQTSIYSAGASFLSSSAVTFNDTLTMKGSTDVTAANGGSIVAKRAASFASNHLKAEGEGSLISFENTLSVGTIIGGIGYITADSSGTISVKGDASLYAAASASNSGNIIFENGATFSGGSLVLRDSGILTVNGGVFRVTGNTSLDLANGTVAVNVGNDAKLNLGTALQGRIHVALLNADVHDTSWTYQLFSEVPEGFNGAVVTVENSNLVRGIDVVCDGGGLLSVTGEQASGDLEWTGGYTLWENGSTGWVTSLADASFHPEDRTLFNGKGQISVSANSVVPGGMEVRGIYSFTGGSINIVSSSEKGLLITGKDADATFSNSVSAPKIQVDNGAKALFDGKNSLIATGGLTVSSGATVQISVSGDKHFSEDSDSEGVEIAKGAQLTVTAGSTTDMLNWQGIVHGEGTLILDIGGLNANGIRTANNLGNAQIGRLIREGHELSVLRLTGHVVEGGDGSYSGSMLQVSDPNQAGNFSAIKELIIEDGNAFVLNAAGGVFGTKENTLTISGNGSYEGAFIVGRDAAAGSSYTLNSNLSLAEDASVAVDVGRTLVLGSNEDAGALMTNGKTLTKNGEGTMELGAGFHSADDALNPGTVNVAQGHLRLSYQDTETLSNQRIALQSGADLLLTDTSDHYTIGSLTGSGTVQLENTDSGTLRFNNTHSQIQSDKSNKFTGFFAPGVNIEVYGGYQAISATLEGEDLYLTSINGSTLDLTESGTSGIGTKLHLTAGSEATDGADATSGNLVMERFGLTGDTSLEVTLLQGSSLNLREAMLEAGANGDPALTLTAVNSVADMADASIYKETAINISLKDNSSFSLEHALLEKDVQVNLLAEDTCSLSLARVEAGQNTVISATLESDDGELIPGLTGSTLDLSDAKFGANSSLAIAAADSSIQAAGVTYAKEAKLDISVADGSKLSMQQSSFTESGELTITAVGSDVNLDGLNFKMTPLRNNETDEIPSGVINVNMTGGDLSLQNLNVTGKAQVNLLLQGDAHALLTGTQPERGLRLTVAGADTLVEGVQLGLGSRVDTVDAGVLNLAGRNSVLLSAGMKRGDATRIFADMDLSLRSGASLNVDITGVLSDILEAVGEPCTYYIADGDLNDWKEHLSFSAEMVLMHITVDLGTDGSLTFRAVGVDDGTIYQSSRDNIGSAGTVWNGGDDVYASMDARVGALINKETHIDLRGAELQASRVDGLVLSNLIGTENGHLFINGDGTGSSLVTISNNLSETSMQELELVLGLNIDHSMLTYKGNITVNGADLRIKHRSGDTGAAKLDSATRMEGVLKLSDSELQFVSGNLILAADGNDLGDVGIAFSGFAGQLVIEGKTAIGGSIHTVPMLDDIEVSEREHILLTNGSATLSLKNGAYVHEGVIIGKLENNNDTPGGVVSVKRGIAAMEMGSRLSHVLLNLEEGALLEVVPTPQAAAVPALASETGSGSISLLDDDEDMPAPRTPADWVISGLTGTGALASVAEQDKGIDIVVSGTDRSFSGDLTAYKGTMTVLGSTHAQRFDGVQGGKDWNLVNAAGGRVVFNLMGGNAPNHLTMGQLHMQEGSFTTILFDMENMRGAGTLITLQGLTIDDGADVTVGQYSGTISLPNTTDSSFTGVLGKIKVLGEDGLHIGEHVKWHLHGIRNATDADIIVKDDGTIYMEATLDNTNQYAKYATNENAVTGAQLIWGVQNSYLMGGDIAAIDNLLTDLLIDHTPTAATRAQASRVMAAVAGASTAVLAEAVNSDMERQLSSIRNRTTTLSYGGDPYSRTHTAMWFNAEANYHKQDADGLMPGYKLNGWGATLGAHSQVSDNATVGVSLTAMYNDVQSSGPDHLKGDIDTYYLSGFAQVAHAAWRHTFVMSLGRANVTANRSVNYGTGQYSTKGTTDGLSFGLLYEMGYTMALKDDYSVCLQPVFNISWRLNQLGSYSESDSSNAALRVEQQTFNAITLGAGVRLQATVGSNVWNRTGIFEGRAMLKVDVADRQGEASVALQKVGSLGGSVKSAERGAVGIELGAGIFIPTGRQGETFIDCSAELRADYANFNATVGYRINF